MLLPKETLQQREHALEDQHTRGTWSSCRRCAASPALLPMRCSSEHGIIKRGIFCAQERYNKTRTRLVPHPPITNNPASYMGNDETDSATWPDLIGEPEKVSPHPLPRFATKVAPPARLLALQLQPTTARRRARAPRPAPPSKQSELWARTFLLDFILITITSL